MRQQVDVDAQLGRCRPSFPDNSTLQTGSATLPGMITALAGIGGCLVRQALTKCRRQCSSGTRVQPLTRLSCATGLTSSNRLCRTSHCRAQAGAAAVAPAPHMPVRLWCTCALSGDATAGSTMHTTVCVVCYTSDSASGCLSQGLELEAGAGDLQRLRYRAEGWQFWDWKDSVTGSHRIHYISAGATAPGVHYRDSYKAR